MTDRNDREHFRIWLESKFIEWMKETNKRQTITDFAEYLEVPRQKLSRWLQGNLMPARENVHRLAAKLGIEIYDFISFDHPDTKLKFIVHNWYLLDPNDQQKISNEFSQLLDS
ncbi:helix-turn-helix domain-containing protein [Chloroflexota bacterium]